ncbi:phosphodiester glycosidase family protein [Clostridium sp. C8-1-8]|jgi:exopolysaccharide biosynthesis protein|uniref:phosphodiester glycosidase family protein n=1 Tax=Clostridium sp. C8-1-8 TaxID=2698831 RepID=UPI001371C688|nr:phosphodiester glycosidase family protein [Clostridium sp. C8-1-8]
MKKKKARNKSRFSYKKFALFIVYIIVFTIVTSPIILLFGPYNDVRKMVLGTVLGTRHSYLITKFLPESTINDLLDKTSESAPTMKEDTSLINIKNTFGNDIERYDFHTDRYDGYMLEVKNPKKVRVAMTKYLGKVGEKTSEFAKDYNAIAAINGGAFSDQTPDGKLYEGTGAVPGGYVISDGKVIYPKENINYDDAKSAVAISKSGVLIVGNYTINDLKKLNVKEAMCFSEVPIIVNGQRQIKAKDKFIDGINPRTAIGQKSDGTILLLVIDGRKSVSKIGANMYDVQEIMMSRGAVNAGKLDGGYSSTMYYDGEVINSPNVWSGERKVATAFYVEK